MRRGEIIKNILENLEAGISDSIDLFEAILISGYGASYRTIDSNLTKIQLNHGISDTARERKKQNFYCLLSKLKKEGFVEKNESNYTLTRLGRWKLKQLSLYLPFKTSYKQEKDSSFKIIIFDIPEKKRYKRDWLRSVLTELGFQKLQRSVWAGKKKVPEDFINDLKEFQLLEYIDIFAVTKTGTIKVIT
ncbi:MAG: CRISPR-associated endonuclease Cas2 [bacterium]